MQPALADPTGNRRLLAAGRPWRPEPGAQAAAGAGTGAGGTPRRRSTDARPVLATAFESTRTAVHVFTEEGFICQTNPAFDRMFGIARGEYLGKHVALLNVASVSANRELLEEMRAAAAQGDVWRGRMENRRRDGTRFPADLQVHALEIGGARYLVGVQDEPAPGV